MSEQVEPLVIRGALVCDGAQPPRPATVVVVGERVDAVIPADAPAEGRELDLRGHLLTPGLVDTHTHLFLGGDPSRYDHELTKLSLPLRALRGAANGRKALDWGVTTVRDVCTEGAGYADVALRDAVRTGIAEGPRVVPSGPGIGITGGYLPMGVAPGVCMPRGCSVCDGVEAVRREVRTQASFGVQWIKVFADWPCPHTAPGTMEVLPTFARDELTALVDEAHRRGRKVATHATTDAGARQAIECGTSSIEHLGNLSSSTLELAAERGVFVVPTLSVVEHGVTNATTEADRDWSKRRLEQSAEAFGRLLAAGVQVAMGTDIGCYPHELGSLSELRLMMSFGMRPLDALHTATSSAARLLEMPDLGRVGAGAIADLCAFQAGSGDLEEALTSGKPALVVQRGKVVRDLLHAGR